MNSANRIRILDFSRACAVLAMIFYHFVYDLGDFGYINLITVINGSWKLFAQSIGCSFLFISGLSFWVMVARGMNWIQYIKRLAILTAAALLVSFVTYLQFGSAFIFFGILHLLATCSILALLIYRLPILLIFCVGIALYIGPEFYFSSDYYSETLNQSLFSQKYFAWTGLYNGRTGSVDFYALMPWSAAFVFGLSIGKILVRESHSIRISPLSFKEEKVSLPAASLLWIGRNSLLIYLIHQPLLYALFLAYQNLF